MASSSRGAGKQAKVKDSWDDDDDNDLDDEVVRDYFESANFRKEELDELLLDDSDDDDESDEDLALRLPRKRDSTQRPVVHNRSSFKRDGYHYSVDEAIAQHREDEFQLATLMMAKKNSRGGAGSPNVRSDQERSYQRYGRSIDSKPLDDKGRAVLNECKRIVAFANGKESELMLMHATGVLKAAIFAVAEACKIYVEIHDRGRHSRPIIYRSDETSSISLVEMEGTVRDVLENPPRRRHGRDRGDRGDRSRPIKSTPKKERQRLELEQTANGTPLEESNPGHMMLRMMGWSEGSGLGVNKDGRTDPVPVKINAGRKGLSID